MSASPAVWLKDILPRTPGIVRKVAARELILGSREFYRETYRWQEVITLSFADGTYAYTPTTAQTDAEVIQILSVEVNGLPLEKTVERPVGDRGTGTPLSWYPTTPGSFEVWPTPDAAYTDVRVRVALIPTEAATGLPDMALSTYYEPILDGTLGRLYAHPAKPYSNPTLGEYHLRRFRNAIGAARGDRKQGGFAGQNWQFPRFGK